VFQRPRISRVARYGLEILMAIDAKQNYVARNDSFVDAVRLALLGSDPQAGPQLFPELFKDQKESNEPVEMQEASIEEIESSLASPTEPTEWIFTEDDVTPEKAQELFAEMMAGAASVTLTPEDTEGGWV
jgi:hypothetical protein